MKMRSPATPSSAPALARASAPRSRLWLEAQLDREPHEPQHAQRVLREGLPRDGPQAAAREVREATERVDRPAAQDRFGDGVDREVAPGEVRLERAAPERLHVDLPRSGPRHDPPRTEVVGEGEASRPFPLRPHAGRERPGGPPGIAFDDHVQVEAVQAESPVAYHPADQPGAIVGERPADDLERIALLHRPPDGSSRGSPSRS